MPTESAGRDLARRIIELSDRIAEHSKQLSGKDFTPTEEFVDETHRLAGECLRLIQEADAEHAQHLKQQEGH